MSDVVDPSLETEPPRGAVKIVYLGPVAPHWDIRSDFGDRAVIDAFRDRVNARLVFLPPHDPHFRRNPERVNRDADGELLLIAWDPGYDQYEEPALGARPS